MVMVPDGVAICSQGYISFFKFPSYNQKISFYERICVNEKLFSCFVQELYFFTCFLIFVNYCLSAIP